MDRVVGRIAALFAALVTVSLLSACQVDVTTDVVMEPDGTGLITVVVEADAEVVAAAPTLAQDLVLDDIVEAGWSIDGPNDTEEGGLALRMSHPFGSSTEATNLLRSLGPPFSDMSLTRDTEGDVTTNSLTGRLVLGGFGSFADEDLVAAVGGEPFADRIAASGATPADSFSATLRAALPGVVGDDTTNAEVNEGEVLVWTLPTDGSPQVVQAATTQRPGEGQPWARPLSIVALIALIAWVSFMTLFVGYVAIARFRRARAYKHRHLAP